MVGWLVGWLLIGNMHMYQQRPVFPPPPKKKRKERRQKRADGRNERETKRDAPLEVVELVDVQARARVVDHVVEEAPRPVPAPLAVAGGRADDALLLYGVLCLRLVGVKGGARHRGKEGRARGRSP